MATYPHSFEAPIVRHDVGTYRYTVVFLPEALRASLGVQGRVRTSGELNDVPFTGAWQPVRGRWYLMLSRPLLSDAGARIGDIASLRFRLEPPDTVEVPEALQSALDADAEAATLWAALRPGQQRGLAHRVASAKQHTTVARRLAEVTRLLIEGGPFGPPPRPAKPTETTTP